MKNPRGPLFWLSLAAILGVTGCFNSSSPSPSAKGGNGGTSDLGKAGEIPTSGGEDAVSGGGGWTGYPDVPYVEIMTDVDGIEIPRADVEDKSNSGGGKITVDVGNEFAKQNPGKPVTGGTIVVRFNSEPKTMNPINETSAVQHIMAEYFMESLAKLNKETLERDPLLAEKWIVEDAIKLSPDFKGHERRVAQAGSEPDREITVDYQKSEVEKQEDPTLSLITTDLDGKPLGTVWVGLYPADSNMIGAPKTGYHFWSDESGKVEIQSIISGTYRVRVGAEMFGESVVQDDGSLTLTPLTANSAALSKIASSENESITLAKGDWIERHQQTTYTYFLHKTAKWSDGTPFTTKDLEFAYAVINNPFVDGESIRVYYQDMISCEGLDDHTIRMQYRQQYFLSLDFTADLSEGAPPWHFFQRLFKEQGKTLTMERLTPEQEEAQGKVSVHGQVFGKFFNTDPRYNDAPLGTGPYIIDKWIRSDRLELRRNPEYWNPNRPAYLDRIIIKFITDNLTALEALSTGEIDFLYRIDAEQYFKDLAGPPDWFKDRYVKAEFFVPVFRYVGWNMLRPKFQDRRVRIALALLFNRQEFVEKKLHGSAALVSGGGFYFGKNYDHTVKPVGYDREIARELLADAGWVDTDDDGILDLDGEKFEFEFLIPPGIPIYKDRAAIMQKSYKEVGIDMSVGEYEWASFLELIMSKNFDVVTLAWVSPPESDPYQIWHSSGAGPGKRSSNHVSFDNPEADALIERIRSTIDEEERKRLHWPLHRILDREQPYMFLYTPQDFGAYHRRYQGVKWFPIRPGFDLAQWYIPKELQDK